MSTNFLAECDYNLNLKDAGVIILQIKSGSLKWRQASDFNVNKARIKQWIEDEKILQDPAKNDGIEIWKIIFYGLKDTAKSLIAAEKSKHLKKTLKKVTEIEVLESQPVHDDLLNKRAPATSSATRYTDETSFHLPSEVISLFNSLKDQQMKLKNMIEDLGKDNVEIKHKLDNMSSKKEKRLTFNESAEVLQYCTGEMAKIRMEKNFDERLKRIDWDFLDVSSKKRQAIIDELRWERKVSKMLANVAKILYGQQLLTHILGRNGRRERSARESERPNTFTISQEDRLREVLKVFGDLFLTDKIWKNVVQHHINQTGRDYKKNTRKRPFVDDESSDSNDQDLNKRSRKDDIYDSLSGNDDDNTSDILSFEATEIPSSQAVSL